MAKKGKVTKRRVSRKGSKSVRKRTKEVDYASIYGSFQNFRLYFWISASVILVSLFLMRLSVDIVSGDDAIRLQHGKDLYKFYASGGKDTTYRAVTVFGETRPQLRYYGGGFEIIPAAINAWFEPDNEYLVRHLVAILFGGLLIIFTGLFVKELLSWRTGLIALWLTFLTPIVVGLSMFNGKDPPTALGFAIFGFFLLRFIKKLPNLSIWNILGIAIGIAVATSVRIGGIMLIGYLFLIVGFAVLINPDLRSTLLKSSRGLILGVSLTMISLLGVVGGLLFYPNFIDFPTTHLIDAFQTVSKFPQIITWLHDGELIKSNQMPSGYLFQELLITLPVLIICSILVFPIIYLLGKHDIKKEYVLLLIFGALFPILYIIYKDNPIYGRWRHVLFVYPFFVGMAATSIDYILFLIRKNKIIAITLSLLMGLYMVKTAYWIVKNNPYQLVYYNEFVGGTKGAYLHYEMDNQQLAAKMSLNWLLESEEFKSALDKKKADQKVVISTNQVSLKSEHLYIPEEYKSRIQFYTVGFKTGYSYSSWDFGIFSTIFIEPNVLRLAYPPKETIHTIEVDGVPISAVVKRENNNDAVGVSYARNKNYERALPYLVNADQYDPDNFRIWYYLALTYYNLGNYEPALEYITKYTQLFPENKSAANMKRRITQLLREQ